MAKLNYDASETETIRPFATVNDCLESIQFKLYADQTLLEQASFIYDNKKELEPEINLNVSVKDITAITQLKKADLILYVAVVNVDLKHSEIVYQNSLDKLTTNKFPVSLPLTNQEMPVDINIVIAEKSNQKSGNYFNRRGIKQIRLRSEGMGGEFPKLWIEPDEFKTKFGLDPSTPWHLHWKAQDLENSVEDLVILYLNNKYHTSISKFGTDATYDVATKQFIISIYTQLMSVIFTKAHNEDDFTLKAPKGLIEILNKKLSITGAEVTKAMESADSYSKIASWAHLLFDMSGELERLQ